MVAETSRLGNSSVPCRLIDSASRNENEELDTTEDISPLQPNKLYYLPTPYDSAGVGRVLMAAMSETTVSVGVQRQNKRVDEHG